MVKSNKIQIKVLCQIIFAATVIQVCPASFTQDEMQSAPLPGSYTDNAALRMPEIQQSTQQNIPPAVTNNENDKEKVDPFSAPGCDKLPVSMNGLHALIDEYKQGAAQGGFDPDNLDPALAWIDGLMKAHNRLANAFARQGDLKSAFDNECSLIRQLRGAKNEILYIKAQTLIKEKKLKQAIPILVNITCSQPNSPLGIKAYQHLTQSGFSGEGNLSLAKSTSDTKANK